MSKELSKQAEQQQPTSQAGYPQSGAGAGQNKKKGKYVEKDGKWVFQPDEGSLLQSYTDYALQMAGSGNL